MDERLLQTRRLVWKERLMQVEGRCGQDADADGRRCGRAVAAECKAGRMEARGRCGQGADMERKTGMGERLIWNETLIY